MENKQTAQRLYPGYFISIEGIEGVGKSTALQFIQNRLDSAGISYVVTREPGGTPIAEAIRTVLLKHYNEMMSPDTELLLMFAGRAQNIAQVILPALRRGEWVLSDRFTDASFAYQGGGRGIHRDHIWELAKWVQADLWPDVTFLLDVPVSVGLGRVNSRGAKDRIETEGLDFFERVRQSYLELAKGAPNRICVVDADRTVDEVKRDILSYIEPMLIKA